MNMPRFRSTAALSVRQRRAAPAVDRATFVLFSLGAHRFAAPVTLVERVLRARPDHAGSTDTGAADANAAIADAHIAYAGRQVPVLDLRLAFGDGATRVSARGTRRLLIFSVQAVWIAAEVDDVQEVATIDASAVESVPVEAAHVVGARGHFHRHGHEVIVLDMLRVVRAVYDVMRSGADV
jgi:chemotaxis signal transduction protein